MSLKDQLTPEQFKAVYNAPFAAATFVSIASGGTIDYVKEMATAGKFVWNEINQGSVSGYGAIVDEVLAAINSTSKEDAKGTTVSYAGSDDAAMRAAAREVVVAAAAAVDALQSAEGYKIWLLAVAQATALTKSGGFLGLGGASVIDAQEQAALDELAGILGVRR